MIGKSNTKNTGPIGVDLGTSSLRVVQFDDIDTTPRLLDLAEESLSSSMAPTNPAFYETSLATTKRLIDRGGFVGRKCVVVLPNQAVQTKNIRMPEMPQSDLASAVAWEASERFGFEPNKKMLTRHLIAGPVQQGADTRMEILIMASPASLMDAVTQAILDSGLEPEAIDVTPTALSYAAAHSLPDESARVLVDVGASATKVVICTNAGPRFYKTVDIGLNQLDRHVAESMADVSNSPRALRTHLDEQPASTQERYTQTIKPWVDEVAQEISLCLRYDAVTYRGNRATQVFLLGGGYQLPSLGKAIQDSASVDIRLFNPFTGITKADRANNELGRWATAVGAALRPRFGDTQKGAA